MSLETIHQKLCVIETMPFWKFLLYFAIVPALLFVLVYQFINPDFSAVIQQHVVMKVMALMAFSAMFLVFASVIVFGGIIITSLLMRFNKQFHYNYGILIGNSLSTNHEFLSNLADGLYKYFISFIQTYNDPRFEELEQKVQREKNELKSRIEKLEGNDQTKDKHIVRLNQKTFALQWVLMRVLRENKELRKDPDQIISKKFLVDSKDEK